jgi:hypothetical protein
MATVSDTYAEPVLVEDHPVKLKNKESLISKDEYANVNYIIGLR